MEREDMANKKAALDVLERPEVAAAIELILYRHIDGRIDSIEERITGGKIESHDEYLREIARRKDYQDTRAYIAAQRIFVDGYYQSLEEEFEDPNEPITI